MRTNVPRPLRAGSPSWPATFASTRASRALRRSTGGPPPVQAGAAKAITSRQEALRGKPRLWRSPPNPAKRPRGGPCYRPRDLTPFARRLLLLWLLGLVARGLFLLLEPATGPVADERTWVVWGSDVLRSPEVHFSPLKFRLIFHPPL